MKRTTLQRAFFLILAATLVCPTTRTSFAQLDISRAPVSKAIVTSVHLEADARSGNQCPITVNFSGYIKTAGAGPVMYTFTRSDGATAPVYTLNFKEAGMQRVTTSWTLGDASVPSYEGWQAIKILSPNVLESSHKTGGFTITCAAAGEASTNTRPNPIGNGTFTAQSDEKISPEVMAAFLRSEQEAPTRESERQRFIDAERVRFEPAANALLEAVRGSNVDLESYLAASKQFVETPAEKLNQFEVSRVNQKFGESLRDAISKAVSVPGVGSLMQTPTSRPLSPGWTAPGQPDPNNSDARGSAGIAACCESRRFEPPFEGLASEGDFGTRAIRPGPVRELLPIVRSAVVAAPHSRRGSGRSFTVPAAARHVSVTVNLGSSWNIGLSGLGFAHVWLGLDMNVTTGGAVVCSATHLEQDNQWTWAGGILTLTSRSIPNFTRTCTFDRRPGDPTTYAANIFASTDATFFGASGGFGEYKVALGPVDVTYCP